MTDVTMPIAPPPPGFVTYWAVSLFSSKTFWFNAASLVVALSSLTEVTTVIPPRFLPMLAAIVAMCNVWLRTTTTRPVAFIAPGSSVPVLVPKVNPPPPVGQS